MNYPPAAEAVDTHLSQSLESLRSSMENGFTRIEGQMRDLVLKDTFRSEVSRLDQADRNLEQKLDGAFNVLESKMESGFAAIEVRDEKRDKEAAARDAERDSKFARRMGWTLTCVGLGFTAFQLVMNFLVS